MRYGILSDIHGNLEAIVAVLETIRGQVDAYVCLGDIVGYGANPNECLELMLDLNCPTVGGNHDWAVAGLTDYSEFNYIAQEATLWTIREMKLKHIEYLRNLPLTLKLDDMLLVHASPNRPERWTYLVQVDEIKETCRYFEERVCFIGHSHIPFAVGWDEEGRMDIILSTRVQMDFKKRYLVNAGSIGQPRDGNAKASVVIYDTETQRIEFIRVPYDVQQTQRKIRDAKLPDRLAQRLEVGV